MTSITGRRVLITGGSGYFGCVLRDRLLRDGATVRIFDRNDSAERPPLVEFHAGDIRDAGAVRNACRDVEIVFHNVAQVPLAKDRDLFWSVNYDGTLRLLEAVAAVGVGKIVHTSSSAVFGVPLRNPVDEATELRPGEPYGAAKAQAEQLVAEWVARRGVDATVIRPRTVLGHGRLGIFHILFRWIEEGRRIPVLGSGENLYQFVHADDLADACIRAATRSGAAVYNIGAERFGTMRETLETLCRHAGTASRVYTVPMAPAVAAMNLASRLGLSPLGAYHSLMYGRSLYFDIRRAKLELAWQPRWSNDEMICQSYDWYRRHKHEIPQSSPRSAHRSPVSEGILGLLRRLS